MVAVYSPFSQYMYLYWDWGLRVKDISSLRHSFYMHGTKLPLGKWSQEMWLLEESIWTGRMDRINWRILREMGQGSPFRGNDQRKGTSCIWIMISGFPGTEDKCREI